MKRVESENARLMVFGCLLGLLIGCPASLGQEPPQESTIDFEHPGDFLVLPGETVHLVTGARITGNLNVFGVVNIHGGAVDGFVRVNESAEATVFGKVLTVPSGLFAGTYAEAGTYDVCLTPDDGVLQGLYEDETPVVLRIECYANKTVTLEVSGLVVSGVEEIQISIRPGSEENYIHLGSNGVIPVAIFSTAGFDATALNPANIFFAGSGVRVRGEPAGAARGRGSLSGGDIRPQAGLRRGRPTVAGRRKATREATRLREMLAVLEAEDNKYLTSSKDVNGDGLPDLVVKVEAANLDPTQLVNGRAYLRVHQDSNQESVVVYEGWTRIAVIAPE